MDIGYDNITTDALARIEGNDFEDFCRELLVFESRERHRGGKLNGPGHRYVADRGRDLLLTTKRKPKKRKERFANALTEDHVGETCFSCKTGKGFRKGILADAKRQPRPLEVLAAGGHYTILVNGRVDETLREQVAGILRKRDASSADPADRVHIYDAHDICDFLKHHAPSISQRFKEKLQIADVPGVIPIDQWVADHESDRALPEFCADPARSRVLEQIQRMLRGASGEPRRSVIWIYGPPGVGKTRLVIEALRRLPRFAREVERRILVALDYERGLKAIDEYDVFRHQQDAILVVDECSPDEHAPEADDIDRIVSRFERRRRGARGALVLIGPLPRLKQPHSLGITESSLEPLDDISCRALVARELGSPDSGALPVLDRILHLSEGYPWFAVLLAQAAREDPGALPEGADRWDAAKLALAPRRKDRETSAWNDEVWLRAQALLLALLTDDADWERLPEKTQKSYRRAVDAPSWSRLMRAAEACHHRGILRLRQGWTFKYVSPMNLAREVAIKLLGPPHWYGKSIREHAPLLLPRLFEKLPRLDLPKNILEKLADGNLDDLAEGPPSIDAFARGDPMIGALGFLARYQPARTAQLLRYMVEGTSLDRLRERADVRRDLVFALEELAQREASFEDAEAALFRLALAENEPWRNSATGAWSKLFFGELNATYRSFSERLEILRGRLSAPTKEERLLALLGLSAALSTRQFLVRDGWELLCEATRDADPTVAARAREVAVKHVRAAVVGGGGAPGLIALAQVASMWSEPELRKLREAIDEAEGYDRAWLDADPGARAALAELRRAVAPSSYSQRLREAVGSRWLSRRRLTGDDLKRFHEQMDRELATKGLAEPSLLIAELDWLGSEEAQRATPFMAEVGRADPQRALLPALLERARAGGPPHLLSGYLLGLVKNGEAAEVDALLRAWREDHRLVRAVLDVVWRIGLTDERAE